MKYNITSDMPSNIQRVMNEINALEEALYATDYKAIKFAEGLIPISDYEPIKAERQALRDRINELEEQLN